MLTQRTDLKTSIDSALIFKTHKYDLRTKFLYKMKAKLRVGEKTMNCFLIYRVFDEFDDQT
jgi:hypothetical protein